MPRLCRQWQSSHGNHDPRDCLVSGSTSVVSPTRVISIMEPAGTYRSAVYQPSRERQQRLLCDLAPGLRALHMTMFAREGESMSGQASFKASTRLHVLNLFAFLGFNDNDMRSSQGTGTNGNIYFHSQTWSPSFHVSFLALPWPGQCHDSDLLRSRSLEVCILMM